MKEAEYLLRIESEKARRRQATKSDEYALLGATLRQAIENGENSKITKEKRNPKSSDMVAEKISLLKYFS